MATKKTNKLTGLRHIADQGACYLAMAFAVLGLAQIFLAGSGVFGRDFSMHVILGRILSTLAIVILILVITARYSKAIIISAVIIFLLAAVGTAALANLGSDAAPGSDLKKLYGGLHALVGLISVIVAEQMGRRVFRKADR